MALNVPVDLSASEIPASHIFKNDQSVILSCNISNTGEDTVLVDVTLRGKYIGKKLSIPSGLSLNVVDGQLFANAGNELKVITDGNMVDVIISFIEV